MGGNDGADTAAADMPHDAAAGCAAVVVGALTEYVGFLEAGGCSGGRGRKSGGGKVRRMSRVAVVLVMRHGVAGG